MIQDVIKIAVAGVGVVGGAVVRALTDPSQRAKLEQAAGCSLQLCSVVAQDRYKSRPNLDISTLPWVANVQDILQENQADIVVELIGGTSDDVCTLIRQSLRQGKTVITANKNLLAIEGPEILQQIIASKRGRIFFEAAVGGSIPMVRTVGSYLMGSRIASMDGILNGTCNWIITSMERLLYSREYAVKKAQDMGYAEQQPTSDLEGYDALYKTILLSGLAYGIFPDAKHVSRGGIGEVTLFDIEVSKRFGYCLRATSRIRHEQKKEKKINNSQENTRFSEEPHVACAVGLELLEENHVLATVNGVMNALHVHSPDAGDLFFSGPGAGGTNTASAVLADLVDAVRHPHGSCHASLFPGFYRQEYTLDPASNEAFYVRFLAKDEAGVMQKVTAILARYNLSIDCIWQDEKHTIKGECYVALMIKRTTHAAVASAYKALMEQKHLTSVVIFPVRRTLHGNNKEVL